MHTPLPIPQAASHALGYMPAVASSLSEHGVDLPTCKLQSTGMIRPRLPLTAGPVGTSKDWHKPHFFASKLGGFGDVHDSCEVFHLRHDYQQPQIMRTTVTAHGMGRNANSSACCTRSSLCQRSGSPA